MNIKRPTMNKNIKLCDEIELNSFHQIQPHGVWLALDSKLQIILYSENAPVFLETPLTKLLSAPILDFLKPEFAEDDIALLLTTSPAQYKHMTWSAPTEQIPVITFIRQHDEYIILEIEKNNAINIQNNSSLFLNEFVIATMQQTLQCTTINELAQTFCEEIKKLTDYHRVIIYQFDERDHSGVVIGECLDKNMPSYIGLQFPATDIPQAVREMYLKNALRYIPTVLEKPVKIVRRSGQSKRHKQIQIDLSNSNLRMVAPVHIEYMSNMGICSSLSIAIIQNKKLWGLIACHHQTPKYVPQSYRLTLSLLGTIFATQALAIESAEDFREEQQMGMVDTRLAQIFNRSSSLTSALEANHKDLMGFVSSTGMSIYLQNVLLNYGETPEDTEIIHLISWLDKKKFLTSYYTSSLPFEYKSALGFKNKACGLFAIKITSLEHHYLLFYKPELINTIAWAGNPAQAIKGDGIAYSPRDSFERFLQTIINHSAQWTKHDIKSAGLIHSLIAARQLQDLLQNQARYDSLTQLLNRLNLEQTLDSEIQRAKRGSNTLVLMMIDLDYFKKINDNYGHQAGDAVLRSFAELIKIEFRIYDYKYRYGGEEFLILLPNLTLEAAETKANNFLLKTTKMQVKLNENTLPSITISLGISSYPNHGNDSKTLLAAADSALYQAKVSGRNKVVICK